MKCKLKSMLTKLILLLGLITFTISKSILRAKNLSNGVCDYDLGRYSFNLNAILIGNLSKAFINHYSFIINNSIKPICQFPVPKTDVNNQSIIIHCSLDYLKSDKLSLSVEGINDELELINFTPNILYINNIFCPKKVEILIGEIKDVQCNQDDSYYLYNYNILISNSTIGENINFMKNIKLEPKSIDENKYYTLCDFVNNGKNKYFTCNLFCNKTKNNKFYYESGYNYKIFSNNKIIYIKNTKSNIYFGENIKCDYTKNLLKELNKKMIYFNKKDNNLSDKEKEPKDNLKQFYDTKISDIPDDLINSNLKINPSSGLRILENNDNNDKSNEETSNLSDTTYKSSSKLSDNPTDMPSFFPSETLQSSYPSDNSLPSSSISDNQNTKSSIITDKISDSILLPSSNIKITEKVSSEITDVPTDLSSSTLLETSDSIISYKTDILSDKIRIKDSNNLDNPTNAPNTIISDKITNFQSSYPSDIQSDIPTDIPTIKITDEITDKTISFSTTTPTDAPTSPISDIITDLSSSSNSPTDVPSITPSEIVTETTKSSQSEEISDAETILPSETLTNIISSSPTNEPTDLLITNSLGILTDSINSNLSQTLSDTIEETSSLNLLISTTDSSTSFQTDYSTTKDSSKPTDYITDKVTSYVSNENHMTEIASSVLSDNPTDLPSISSTDYETDFDSLELSDSINSSTNIIQTDSNTDNKSYYVSDAKNDLTNSIPTESPTNLESSYLTNIPTDLINVSDTMTNIVASNSNEYITDINTSTLSDKPTDLKVSDSIGVTDIDQIQLE